MKIIIWIFVALVMLFATVICVTSCMLSGKISREEERLEFERRLKEDT
jgi:hypothetical protein